MSQKLLEEIKTLFEQYVADSDIYPSGWKHIVSDLQRIANSDPLSPFDSSTKSGFNYLEIVRMVTICDKCHDVKAFQWMKAFARAWLDSTELPKFCHSCWFSESE